MAAIVVVGLLVVAHRYGFHRDELYFIAAGRRLAWGYVDQPPLTPLLARLGDLLPGALSPLAIRIVPAFSAGAVVVLAALMARRFGGGRTATVLAAVFTAGGGFYLAVGHLLSTATFDLLIWAAVILVVVMLLDGADARWWLMAGGLVGVGLLNKHTIVALVVALLIGILVTPQREILCTPWMWLGGLVALLMATPNLAWQAANGWPQLEMAGSLQEAADGPADYMLLQLAILSTFLVIPAVAGFGWLWADERGRRWRALPIAFVLLFVVFLLTGGKGYYVSPLYLPLLAAGALWVQRLSTRTRAVVLALVGFGIAVGLFLSLPILSAERVGVPNEVNPELGETYAWDQLVDEVETVYESVPEPDRADTVIFTSNYGQAGAIEVLGDPSLPQPVSAHNNYWLWSRPAEGHGPIVAVGDADWMRQICPDIEVAAVFTNAADLDNDEQGTEIWLCQSPEVSLASVWNLIRHYN